MREWAIQVFHIEEFKKQKHETMRHHYLKDIAMAAFERCKS